MKSSNKFKTYYHRYGVIQEEEFNNYNEAVKFIQEGAENGELFGDCITDENKIVIRDFDAETHVCGRETPPKSRVGQKFKKEGE